MREVNRCGCGVAARPDRPHVLLAQEPGSCPGCGGAVQVRTFLRDGKVVRASRCKACGVREELLPEAAAGFTDRFLAPGRGATAEARVFKRTTSSCPSCLSLVPADVVIRDGRVFLEKSCPRCGRSQALACEDARYYVEAYTFARAGSRPLRLAREAKAGCPEDCGLCDDHEQHTCVPIFEVTDSCNLSCPICLADNAQAHHLEPELFSRMVDRLLEAEGTFETLALSGGEPTSHPKILELIEIASRPEVGRVMLLTNGIRLGADPGFAEELKARGVYVGLQLDGFTREVHEKLRGRDLTREKAAALETLERLAIPTQLVFVAARGVNEDQIGKAVELFLSKEHIISLNFQPLAFTGQGGGSLACDPLDRLTIPGVLRDIERGTSGKLLASDFVPLPCPSPHCTALSFLLRLEDGSWLPFPRFADLRAHGKKLLRNSATLPALPEVEQAIEEVIYSVYARQDELPWSQKVLAALRRTVAAMFPGRALGFQEALRMGERQVKSIFVHHYMDRFDFDLERLRKCCNHYPQADGRLMPACGFNLFHRGVAKGAGTPRASFGIAPWS